MDIHRLTEIIQSEATNLESYVNELLSAIQNDKQCDEDEISKLAKAFLDHTLPSVVKCERKYEDETAAICERCLMKRQNGYFLIAEGIFAETNIVKWGKRPEQVSRMVRGLSDVVQLSGAKDKLNTKTLVSCVTKMMNSFTGGKLYQLISDDLFLLLINCYKSGSELSVAVGKSIVGCYDLKWKVNKERLPDLYEEMFRLIEQSNINDEPDKCSLICGTISCMDSDAILAPTELSRIYNHCLSKDLYGSPFSGYGNIVHDILWVTVKTHYAIASKIKDFVPGTVALMNCGVKALEDAAGSAISTIYQQLDLLVPCAEEILQVYLDGKGGLTLGMVLKPLYQAAPEKIMNKINNINESMEDMDDIEKTYLYLLLDEIAKTRSEKLLPVLKIIVNDLRSTSICFLAYVVVAEISSSYPAEVAKHYRTLLQTWDRVPDVTHSAARTVANIGLMSEEDAERCLRAMVKRLQTVGEEHKGSILMEMKRIGEKYKQILARYKANIEDEKRGTALGLGDTVNLVLDFIEDRTLDILDSAVKVQRSEAASLDERAKVNAEAVRDVDEETTHNSRSIEEMKQAQEQLGKDISVMEEDVKETQSKVAEIDQKTLTNAPKWSRDVSKILNPEHEYDWRYLAVRLGYSGEDVLNWALSPDPTVAILAEWYTTHKSSDATYAIHTVLRDMGRTEAVEIVERALEEADQIVPKPIDEMSDKPCPVFISYQWDHQPEVKAIKDHLEMAGYRCWMDIGQMGGGDQLFAKINDGMRAAKIVLCMVTSKYARSENCNKEVNLANLLNKPIIPILIENISWPPEGSMSMLFAQLLYIQFFSEGEYVRGDKFWPNSGFQELLRKISYYAPSEPEMFTGDNRAHLFKSIKHGTSQDQDIAVSNDSDVFLSYEWNMRSKVTDIHHRLTNHGFKCWMDNARNDVVEATIRNAKVVVACLSEKYFLSSDCKLQLKLSDDLNKSILLVLIDGNMTWPPNGPIGDTVLKMDNIDIRRTTDVKDGVSMIVEKLNDILKQRATNNNHKSKPNSALHGDKHHENKPNRGEYPKDDEKVMDKPSRNVSDTAVSRHRDKSSQVYVKHVSAPGSSRSLPERSRTPAPSRLQGRAESDQVIPKGNKQSRRSSVCIII